MMKKNVMLSTGNIVVKEKRIFVECTCPLFFPCVI